MAMSRYWSLGSILNWFRDLSFRDLPIPMRSVWAEHLSTRAVAPFLLTGIKDESHTDARLPTLAPPFRLPNATVFLDLITWSMCVKEQRKISRLPQANATPSRI